MISAMWMRLSNVTLSCFRTSRESDISVTSAFADTVMAGVLERKHESEDGGKRASSRSWKNFFAVIRNGRFELFHNQESFEAGDQPLSVLPTWNVRVEVPEYSKRSFSFRVITQQGSEFLFNATSQDERIRWMQNLDPSSLSSSNSDNGSHVSVKPAKDKKGMFGKILSRKTKS